jgi:hypothetical protein
MRGNGGDIERCADTGGVSVGGDLFVVEDTNFVVAMEHVLGLERGNEGKDSYFRKMEKGGNCSFLMLYSHHVVACAKIV